jgi:hypothetical protein
LVGHLVFGYGIPKNTKIVSTTSLVSTPPKYVLELSNNLTENLSIDNVLLVHGDDPNKDYVLNFSDGTGSDRSSTLSKYITKRVDLETAAPILKIIFDANIPSESNLKIYVKTSQYNDVDFNSLEWKLVNPEDSEVGIRKTNNPNEFLRNEYSYEEEEFIAFSVKIEMTSSNSTSYPRIKNIKAIAVT